MESCGARSIGVARSTTGKGTSGDGSAKKQRGREREAGASGRMRPGGSRRLPQSPRRATSRPRREAKAKGEAAVGGASRRREQGCAARESSMVLSGGHSRAARATAERRSAPCRIRTERGADGALYGRKSRERGARGGAGMPAPHLARKERRRRSVGRGDDGDGGEEGEEEEDGGKRYRGADNVLCKSDGEIHLAHTRAKKKNDGERERSKAERSDTQEQAGRMAGKGGRGTGLRGQRRRGGDEAMRPEGGARLSRRGL